MNQEPFFSPSSVEGTLTFTSSLPISAVALRGFTNDRAEFLITTLPMTSLPSTTSETLLFPHYADGGGWSTQMVLLNPSDQVIGGTIAFFSQSGSPVSVTVSGQANNQFTYSIPPRTSRRLQTSGTGGTIRAGAALVTPSPGSISPAGVGIFSFVNGGTTVSETGVRASPAGTVFRVYVEASGQFGAVGSVQSGIAIANASTSATTVTLEFTGLTGLPAQVEGMVTVPANGQVALFLNQISGFASIRTPVQGLLRISSPSSAGVSVIGLRGRYNERGDFLISTTPPADESAPAAFERRLFPHFAFGGGYTTQFVLFSRLPAANSSGIVRFYGTTGQLVAPLE
jgi:hypothetical protein